MTQTSTLEQTVYEAVKIFPEQTAYDYAAIIELPNTDIILKILDRLQEKRLVRNIDEQNELNIRSIWMPI